MSHTVDLKTIRVAIALDNQKDAVRLNNKLVIHEDIKVVAMCSGEEELAAAFKNHNIDVLISDVTFNYCDSFPLFQTYLKDHPSLNVLCYTKACDEGHVIRAVNCGVTGYILRDSHEDLAASVRLVHRGGSPVSPIVARFVLRALHTMSLENQKSRQSNSEVQRLSRRELEILQLLAKGIPFVDIGNVLSISPHTVTAHIKKIYRKLGVHSRGECVYEARCLGLLPPV